MFGMQLDRFSRDHQFARNLLIREICVEQTQNLQLAPGQWLQALFRQQIFLRVSWYCYRLDRCQDALEIGIQMPIDLMLCFSAPAHPLKQWSQRSKIGKGADESP